MLTLAALWIALSIVAIGVGSTLLRALNATPSGRVADEIFFAILPKRFIPILQKRSFFYDWNEEISEVRFMTSWDTTEDDIRSFVGLVKKTIR